MQKSAVLTLVVCWPLIIRILLRWPHIASRSNLRANINLTPNMINIQLSSFYNGARFHFNANAVGACSMNLFIFKIEGPGAAALQLR